MTTIIQIILVAGVLWATYCLGKGFIDLTKEVIKAFKDNTYKDESK